MVNESSPYHRVDNFFNPHYVLINEFIISVRRNYSFNLSLERRGEEDNVGFSSIPIQPELHRFFLYFT